jgi:dihydropteroate synthase
MDNGDFYMKPNFEQMTNADLKAYVLSHRDDDEAIRVLFSRRNPPDSEATWYGPMSTPEGEPIEENIRIAEEAIRQRIERSEAKKTEKETLQNQITEIDSQLSNRHLNLDPGGYFIIYLDREAGLICAKHFTNVIDERGLAVDPETGKVIPAKGKVQRTHETLFTARTAKELCVKIFEETQPSPVTMLDHAAYLGREFMQAQIALVTGQEYIQD